MGMRDWEREGGGEEKIQSTSVDYFCLFPLLLARIFCREPITLYACIMDTLAKEFQFWLLFYKYLVHFKAWVYVWALCIGFVLYFGTRRYK